MASVEPFDVMLQEQGQAEDFNHERNKIKAIFVESFPEHEEQGTIHQEDAGEDRDGTLISPKPYDVICGKDKFAQAHPGNKKFRCVILSQRKQYQTSESLDEKKKISQGIGEMIRSLGGRFLKFDPDTNVWSEVSDECTRDKISHALRSAKDPNQPKSRRKRTVTVKGTTKEEDNLFLIHFLEQQRVFENLVREYEEGRRPSC